jgi:hypothetical protein
MDKGNSLFLYSSQEHMSLNNVFGKTLSNSDSGIQDKRVASCWCYCINSMNPREDWEHCFLNPFEARDVIAAVLEGLEMQDLIPERP